MPPEGLPVVEGFDHTTGGLGSLDRLVELAASTLVGESSGPGKLDLIVVDRDEMADLNLTHMGQQGPTDVLAFPLDASDSDDDPDDPDAPGVFDGLDASVDAPPRHLGDVIICPDVARDQAAQHCGTYDAELSLLVIHGVLHVLGHDHGEPEETEVMQRRERVHMTTQGFGHPRWNPPPVSAEPETHR